MAHLVEWMVSQGSNWHNRHLETGGEHSGDKSLLTLYQADDNFVVEFGKQQAVTVDLSKVTFTDASGAVARPDLNIAGSTSGLTWQLPDNAVIQTDKYDLVRLGDPNREWGQEDLPVKRVSAGYSPIGMGEFVELLDPLSEVFEVDSLIVIDKGRVLVATFKMPDFYVGDHDDERHESNFTVILDHKGGGIPVVKGATRVVCMNTVNLAIAIAERENTLETISLTRNAKTALDFRVMLEEAAVKAQADMIEEMNRMFITPMKDFSETLTTLYPYPTPPARLEQAAQTIGGADTVRRLMGDLKYDEPLDQFFAKIEPTAKINMGEKRAQEFFELVARTDAPRYQQQLQRVENVRQGVAGHYAEFNDLHPYAAGTEYAAFNAVTAQISHGSEQARVNGSPDQINARNLVRNNSEYNNLWKVFTEKENDNSE